MLKKVPHTYTIVFSIIIICAILTWIIPGGEYNGVGMWSWTIHSMRLQKARKHGKCFQLFSTGSKNKPELSLLS